MAFGVGVLRWFGGIGWIRELAWFGKPGWGRGMGGGACLGDNGNIDVVRQVPQP